MLVGVVYRHMNIVLTVFGVKGVPDMHCACTHIVSEAGVKLLL